MARTLLRWEFLQKIMKNKAKSLWDFSIQIDKTKQPDNVADKNQKSVIDLRSDRNF